MKGPPNARPTPRPRPRQTPIYGRRAKFVDGYCAAKGWDRNHLTSEQVFEIRRQPLWVNPEVKNGA